MDIDSDVDSPDEELEEGLPICVQGTLSSLRSDRFNLINARKTLKRQLEESQMWSRELEKQLDSVKARLVELEAMVTPAAEECVKCQQLQLQLDEVGERLGNGQLSFLATDKETVVSVGVQTDEPGEVTWSPEPEPDTDITNHVASHANSVMEQQGMVYEETSGLWYDYKSGYYFDAASGLYYDGNNGVWYRYDVATGQYIVNSWEPEEEVRAQRILSQAARDAMEARKIKEEKRRKRKERKRSGDNDKSEKADLGEALSSLSNVLATHDYSDDDDGDPGAETIPCVRIVIIASEDPDVELGSLFLVTCKGGSIGSRGHHEVLLVDKGCSRHHARLTYSEGKYWLKDLGSRNGTWVSGKRISVSKQESEEVEIGHGTLVQIGKTKLLCHLHPGRETCLECEPGLVKAEIKENIVSSKEDQRKDTLQTMKRKYGLDNPGEDLLKMEEKNGYNDRAKERRKLIGSSHTSEKTMSADMDTVIGQDNKGYKMLAKMGFKGGSLGLGKNNQGRSEPIKVEQRQAKAGLGASNSKGTGNSLESRKNAIWLKTQKRFTNSSVLDAFNQDDSEEEETANS